jgi:predicted DNA-binding transcriptional regulator YafY
MVRRALDPVSADAVLAGAIPPGPDGWVQVTIAYEDLDMATHELLRFGSEVEVVEPIELRARMADTARAMLDRYATVPG